MQKPNYQYEKRRKELDKKAKKEQKWREKLAAGRSSSSDPAEDGTEAVATDETLGTDGATETEGTSEPIEGTTESPESNVPPQV
ncbi:MAG: hypothetical protein EXS25_04815 [Pedosphaera sp.]|nr:hypothetical protein [Pedosphaera sp.]